MNIRLTQKKIADIELKDGLIPRANWMIQSLLGPSADVVHTLDPRSTS